MWRSWQRGGASYVVVIQSVYPTVEHHAPYSLGLLGRTLATASVPVTSFYYLLMRHQSINFVSSIRTTLRTSAANDRGSVVNHAKVHKVKDGMLMCTHLFRRVRTRFGNGFGAGKIPTHVNGKSRELRSKSRSTWIHIHVTNLMKARKMQRRESRIPQDWQTKYRLILYTHLP